MALILDTGWLNPRFHAPGGGLGSMMRRTTIVAPDELMVKLRRIAAERGTSMASIVREALEDKVKPDRPKLLSLGSGESNYTDTSELASDWHLFTPRSWR